MSERLKPYSEYKNSGLPWLGEIPSHWEIRRNGRLFAQRNETGYPDLPILEVSLKTGVRVRDFENSNRKQVMTEREKYKRALQGDITFNMMRMWQGAVGVVPTDGLVSPAYIVARPYPEIDSRYYSYLFRTGAYMNEINKYSRGIVTDRNRLYWEDFKQMPSVFPTIREQRAIAGFLDGYGIKIRRFIRNKRQMIGLLNEQRQVTINQAVTRGLNPNESSSLLSGSHTMSRVGCAHHAGQVGTAHPTSGVEWLGDVPEHWKNCRLKHVAVVQTGITLGKNYLVADLENRPYLRVANVQDGRLDLSDIAEIRVPPKEASGCELQPGDVLMTEGGDIDKLGRGCIWNGEIPGCLHQNHVFAVRTDRSKLLPEYLTMLMTSIHGRMYFMSTAKKTTNLASTNTTILKSFPLFLPTVEEQGRILNHISAYSASFDKAIQRARNQIDLIHEYRTRLIADVVTGKLDVRNAPIEPIEEEIEEIAGLDDADAPETATLENASEELEDADD